ncbi:hypothetical protein AJ79_02717 [Helicocarpus griseus UAMH5409]|uniref:Very-long-chain 3-oxoacyl-CoA synthase n=1 Tax=Helicocarpus griseus UAMH5409 TaxID=1447875 RepID=A0A2B7Y1G6_9EURO|nr:hypothetical protein AJ79_02717 [Helicocarpus griseus UAMH5409]
MLTPTLLPATLIFLFLSTIIYHHVHVRKNGPIPYTSTLIKLNNRIYALASLLFCLALVLSFEPILQLLGNNNNNVEQNDRSAPWLYRFGTYVHDHDGQMRYIYHVSKVYEYIDVLLVLAGGGQIGWHFGVHHLTTPYLTYLRLIVLHHRIHYHQSDNSGWKVLACLNTLHHVFMYLYFGGVTSVRPILPFTGCLQLIVGIVGEGNVINDILYNNGRTADVHALIWPSIVSMAAMGLYFVLFVLEVREAGRGKGREQKKIGQGNAHNEDEKDDRGPGLEKEKMN